MYFNEVMSAGAPKEIIEAGTFFRIIESQAEDIAVVFYLAGREVARVGDVGAGYFERLDFDKVVFTSTAGGRLRLVTRVNADVGYDRAIGSVAIGGTVTVKAENGVFTQAQMTATAGGSNLLPANPLRRYFFVQNKDQALEVHITLDGSAATAGKGVRLLPGESYWLESRVPTAAINAISPGGANANLVVLEA